MFRRRASSCFYLSAVVITIVIMKIYFKYNHYAIIFIFTVLYKVFYLCIFWSKAHSLWCLIKMWYLIIFPLLIWYMCCMRCPFSLNAACRYCWVACPSSEARFEGFHTGLWLRWGEITIQLYDNEGFSHNHHTTLRLLLLQLIRMTM